MFGFTIIYNNEKNNVSQIGKSIHYLSPKTNRQIDFYYQQSTKFLNDKCFIENNEFIVGLDGFILNLIHLKKQYNSDDTSNLFIKLYNKYGIGLLTQFKGEFSGFIFIKNDEKLYCFTNQLGSKRVYYSICDKTIIISPSINIIAEFRNNLTHKNSLNIGAAYSLLTFGGLLENQTLIENVYKLQAGNFLEINAGKLILNQYHSFNNVETEIYNKKEAIHKLDEVFNNNILLEYNKDKEYNYKHLATLSGGLDSRMNVMTANKYGYNTVNFCFSQTNYLDQQIAQQISSDLNNDFIFIPLDKSNYYKDTEENMDIYEGQIFYLSSAHYNYALKQLDLKNYGLIHTGQIGDGVLGGFLTDKNNPNYFSKIISNKLFNKIPHINLKNYSTEETFKLINRVFNVTIAGSYVSEHHESDLVSPFLDTDFIELCLSIDFSLKYKSKIYIDWINTIKPEIAKYKWEKTGFKPTSIWKSNLSRYTKKISKTYYSSFNKQNRMSMNPYEYWYKNNTNFSELYQNIFNESIQLIKNIELKNDVTMLFKTGNVIEKSFVITLLLSIKKFNLIN